MISNPLPFQVAEKKLHRDAHLLVVRGELDISAAPKFRESVAATPTDATNLVMDLSELEFIDSSGIQVLIEEQKRLGAENGKLVIVCASPKMRDLFRLTGVDKVCTVVSSRAEALEASVTTQTRRRTRGSLDGASIPQFPSTVAPGRFDTQRVRQGHPPEEIERSLMVRERGISTTERELGFLLTRAERSSEIRERYLAQAAESYD